jgi:hypothetical protein
MHTNNQVRIQDLWLGGAWVCEGKAPSGRVALTRTTRKDKHRKYRSISEMRNALKLNQQFFEGLKYRDRSVMSWTIRNAALMLT